MIYIYSKKLHADEWKTGSMQAQILSSMYAACVLKKTGVDESHSFFIIKVGRTTINLIKIN